MVKRRPNFASIKARNDKLAWKAIHSRPIPSRPTVGWQRARRPDYRELADAIAGVSR